MATYTLSTGVDSRATHGILWITSGKYPPGFFPNIYLRAIYEAIVWLNYLRNVARPAFIPHLRGGGLLAD